MVAQEFAADRFEVVVLDDGSTDGTEAMVRAVASPVPVTYRWQPNHGRAAARNAGSRLARGRVLLYLDADIIAQPDLVSRHYRLHASSGGPIGVQGRTLQHPESLTTTFMRATNLLPDLTVRRRRALSPLHVITRNFSVSAAAFWEVGGFDEAFAGYGWEDIELALRLHRSGVRLLYDPEALAHHHHIQGLDELLPKLRQAGEGAVYFWQKHGRSGRLGLFLEIHPALMPLKWLVYRAGVITRLVEAIRPWAERRAILPLCSEIYNHLLWRAYYEGAFTALRASRT